MPQTLRIALVTLLWYGALSGLLIFVVAPWLHSGAGYPMQGNVTLAAYQKRATISAAIGYPLVCAALIFGAASRAKRSPLPMPRARRSL